MKTKYLSVLLMMILQSLCYGQFQKSVQVANQHFHDLNIAPLDGTDDFIVAGNLFDSTMQNEELTLQRMDNSGNIVWFKKYNHASLQHLRVFDITTYLDLIFVTGSVDVGGFRQVMISRFDAINGNWLDTRHYEIVGPGFNSRGLKIEYTESDADGDGSDDPGFVVVGFFSDCYNVDITCVNNNIGFVMRVDFGLNLIWTTEIDTNLSNNPQDYDFANGFTETSDGFFITGSATGPISSSFQQASLHHKIDFMGNFVWDNSYIFGNSNDISVDAYYDAGSDEIYVLNNYSVSHYFGVTVINNTTGVINFAKSWYVTQNDLNRYGFVIMESDADPNNLVITGYDRDENWVDGNNNSYYGETNIFVYEFAKATGAQVGPAYQYLVENIEPPGEDFNFWLFQMPLIYYPDISFRKVIPGTTGEYFHVGYRRNSSGGFVEEEVYRTPNHKRNECDNITFQLNLNALSITSIPAISGIVPNSVTPITLNETVLSYTEEICFTTLGTNDLDEGKVEIYPNPAQNYFVINANYSQNYKIYDTMGRLVQNGMFESKVPINIDRLNSGIYFIQLESSTNQGQLFKLIKR
ncbi:MAG: T9SS type A sorting domain-containing protein [Flavobacteriaceae bacterium]|nr:T9SS type A sorting domain-containing protein [Flavobacteriaceae bacterium]